MRKYLYVMLSICLLVFIFPLFSNVSAIQAANDSPSTPEESPPDEDQIETDIIDEPISEIDIFDIDLLEAEDGKISGIDRLILEESDLLDSDVPESEQNVSEEANANITDFIIKKGVVTGYKGKGGDIIIPSEDSKGNQVTAIGKAAFKGNDSITSVTIPSSVTKIGTKAFMNCAMLESVIYHNTVQTMGNGVFQNCKKLRTIKLDPIG